MNSADSLDSTLIPYLVGEGLRRRFQRNDIEAIDSSEVGLYTSDGALFVDKLLGRGVDVIVYGLTLRALPLQPVARYVSRIGDEMSLGDLVRMARIGGAPWLVDNLGAEHVITGVVRTNWATYAYRSSLRRFIWESTLEPVAPSWPALERMFKLPAHDWQVLVAPRQVGKSPYEWTREAYGIPNPNWEALDLIGRMCQRYAPGRCVLYAGPVNPFGRDRTAEPGLYEDYLAHVRIIVGRYGLIFRDYTDTMSRADFRKPKYGGQRDSIHLNEAGRAALANLLVGPVAQAMQQAIDEHDGSRR